MNLESIFATLRDKLLGFPGTIEYWERRYRTSGDSGQGSYGEMAEFKAEVVNSFVDQKNIETVVEFGCGDGNQLKYMEYEQYTGLDVSEAAIKQCKQKFSEEETRNFFLYDPYCFVDNTGIFESDLSLT